MNDPERIPVPEVEWDGERLRLGIPHYRSEILARWNAEENALVGEWTKVRGPDRIARVPFRARHDAPDADARRRASLPKNVSGSWAVDFESDELGAVGIFQQEVGSSSVRGTFLTATGDYRYLAGGVEGNQLRLSCFDGAHAFLFDAELDAEENLSGVFHSGNWWHETWTAERDPEASVVDPFAQTTWDARVSLADLSFPDLEGNLRCLADPEFAGKGYLIVLFGSWCPNCHDEAPYLVELHEKYGEQGLSVLGLSFELTGDFEEDAEQVAVFRERHGIDYPLFVAGTADKKTATEIFGAVDFLRSYPTSVFLESDGSVRAV
ncbi:MAG: TlpA disulfide reductase family protein, partial [Planctomycetota bacterium]